MPSLASTWIAALAAMCPIAQEPPPPSAPTTCERARSLLQQGQHEPAMEALRAALAEDRALVEERVLLARVLAWLGRSEQALTLLREGLPLVEGAEEVELQWEIGLQWKQLGDDGPFFERRGSQVAYLPADPKIDEGAWRKDRHRRALEAFLLVLEAQPDLEAAYEQVGELQAELGEPAAALATWSAAAERFPASRSALFGRARALGALDRKEEAIAACLAALEVAPRVAEMHELLAELRERTGQAELAAQARARARFYAWAPEFLELDFADAGALLPRLVPELDENASREAWKTAYAGRTAEIERLLAQRDATSTKLLAALCFHHEDHGEVEQRCFAELGARGASSIPVLRALLEQAQTTCTQRGAAHALARLRAPGLLPVLVELLPGDVRAIHEADIAGALAQLGDPAAVTPLLALADLGSSEVDAEGEDFFVREGRLAARHRAVWALGTLGGEAARVGLLAGIARKDLGAACRVALYRITRDAAMVAPLRAAVLADESLYQQRTLAYLREFAPELAAEIAKDGASAASGEKK